MAALLVKTLRPVGRYALGVLFSDGHDSILPYRELRARCPCEACAGGAVEDARASDGRIEIADLQQMGDQTICIRWRDGHETLYIADELRGLCRCAYCIGEPNYPITRQ